MEKARYERKFGEKSQRAIVLASLEASIIATVLTSPLWVIKTRLILNTKTDRTVNIFEKGNKLSSPK